MPAVLELLNYGKKRVSDYASAIYNEEGTTLSINLNSDFFKLFENDDIEVLSIMMNTIFYRYANKYDKKHVIFDNESQKTFVKMLNKKNNIKFERIKLLMICHFEDSFKKSTINDMKETIQLVREFIEQMKK